MFRVEICIQFQKTYFQKVTIFFEQKIQFCVVCFPPADNVTICRCLNMYPVVITVKLLGIQYHTNVHCICTPIVISLSLR